MILLISDSRDEHGNVIEKSILEKTKNIFRLNLDVKSLEKTKITFRNNQWEIIIGKTKIITHQIKKVIARRAFVELTVEEEKNRTNDFLIWKGEWNKTLLGLYLDLKEVPWLNPLKNTYRTENKYLQIKVAKEIGLKMPQTIVSNQKEDLINFSKENSTVVLKLLNQSFYMKDNDMYGFYVNQISTEELENFSEKDENPVMLQEYIDKSYEVRYTFVDGNHFVCKIDSQKSKIANIDWRKYDLENTPHEKITPPERIKQKVELLMKSLGIIYGGLDFIVSNNNEWFFLEVNPAGQYLWIEYLTNLPITTAISDWAIKKSY